MTHHYLIPPGVLSEGTLRPDDILRALLPHAEAALAKPHHHPGNLDCLKLVVGEAHEVVTSPRPLVLDLDTSEAASELVDELLDLLSDYTPPGHVLGFHPDDGAALVVMQREETP